MRRDRTILFTAIAPTLGAAILLFTCPEPSWLRIVIGLPFALILPGHAVMLLVDPDRLLGRLEWFTLSVGVSLSLSMLVGMGLAASIGLSVNGTIATLAVMTSAMLVMAQARIVASTSRQRATYVSLDLIRYPSFGALALLACGMLVLLISIPRADTSSSANIVQLWGLPNESGDLRIGAKNINSSSRRYHLAVRQGERVIVNEEIGLPAGSSHILLVKASAMWTKSAPVVAVLTDPGGRVRPRTIRVWGEQ
jgi:hypothetical protein